MFEIYAHSYLEASRFTPNTRPGPHVQQHLDRSTAPRRHVRGWRLRFPFAGKCTES
jgi:hypothetical protein